MARQVHTLALVSWWQRRKAATDTTPPARELPPIDVAHLHHWFELTVDEHVAVDARVVAAELVARVPLRSFRRIDAQMRSRSPYHGGVPRAVLSQRFEEIVGTDEHRWHLLGLLSMSRDGHVRERAVRALRHGPDEVVVGYLMLRVDDWVPEVRAVAVAAVDDRREPDRGAALLAALPVVWDRLMSTNSWGRARDVLADLNRWLDAEPQRSLLWQGLESDDIWVVRLCASRLRELDDLVALQRRIGRHRDLLVASWVAMACLEHDESAAQVIKDLLDSRFGLVREGAAFWALKHQPSEELVSSLMLDRLRIVRWQAQAHLRRTGDDPAAWYRARAEQSAAAAQGLAEVATPDDRPAGFELLASDDPRRRVAGAQLLGRIGGEGAVEALLVGIADPDPRVSRRSAEGLARLGVSDTVADELVAAASVGPPHVARNVRRALLAAPRWTRLIGSLQMLNTASTAAALEGVAVLDRALAEWQRASVAPTGRNRAQVEAELVALRRHDEARADLLVSTVGPDLWPKRATPG